mgnify:CR=1 FL=1
MHSFSRFVLIALSACVAANVHAITLTIDAGESDRENTPVHINVPLKQLDWEQTATIEIDGETLPAQVELITDEEAQVWFILPELAAGESIQATLHPGETADAPMFRWAERSEILMNLSYGGRPVMGYFHPQFDPDDIEHTKKPFHHVYSPTESGVLLTKGVGGRFSHHRGIFYGYNHVHVGEETYDIWHANNGEHSQHIEVLEAWEGPVMGGHTVRIDWIDREGEAFIREHRTLRAFRQPGGQAWIDFDTELESLRGDIALQGDRQHAGVQFRAAQEVAENQETTRYLRPETWAHLEPDQQYNGDDYLDLPWNAIRFLIDDTRYTVAYLTDPSNPDGARFSERLYGRFGEYIPDELAADETYTLHYQWWVTASPEVTRETIEERYADLADPPTVQLAH